eukprot:COSAG01_NODE_47410_length_390_cov_1.560137_1_plen_49_part_10
MLPGRPVSQRDVSGVLWTEKLAVSEGYIYLISLAVTRPQDSPDLALGDA